MRLPSCKISVFFSILLCFFSLSCHPPVGQNAEMALIQRPIKFSKKRIHLTKGYMKDRYKISNSHTITPQMIVVHWTAIDSLEKSFQAFNSETLKHSRPMIDQSALNVSIHFLVSKEGKIYQLMPDHWMARHCIGLNHLAIGIENVGGKEGKEDLTHAQVKANVALIQYLKARYPNIQYLIGHYEYLLFENSSLWKEKPSTPRTQKIDPGKKFMNKVRVALKRKGQYFFSRPQPR